ncbi:MAG: Mov34/MPN/PAD-1 family protein [Candidatus Anstonellaceae archaeon]
MRIRAIHISLQILVKRKALLSALAGAKSALPNEFICLLTGRKTKNAMIVEDTLIPPMIMVSETTSSFNDWMIPIVENFVGTFHSHPSGSRKPSDEDLWLFQQKGGVHFIASKPFDENSVDCYLGMGRKANFKVVD